MAVLIDPAAEPVVASAPMPAPDASIAPVAPVTSVAPVTTVALTTTAVFAGASAGTSSSLIPRMTSRLVPSGSPHAARAHVSPIARIAASLGAALIPKHTRAIGTRSRIGVRVEFHPSSASRGRLNAAGRDGLRRSMEERMKFDSDPNYSRGPASLAPTTDAPLGGPSIFTVNVPFCPGSTLDTQKETKLLPGGPRND